MKRGGRGRMAGMAGGVAWGAIWGSLVGGLVLLLAALLLDLGSGNDVVTQDAVAPPPVAPDAGPVLLPRMAALAQPRTADMPMALPIPADPRLSPRPAQPVLPRLAVAQGLPVLSADVPPVPAGLPAAPVEGPLSGASTMQPSAGVLDGLDTRVTRSAAPDPAARIDGRPALFGTAEPDGVPERPAGPGPLIAASTSPAISPAPDLDEAAPVSGTPGSSGARSVAPVPAPIPTVALRPQPPGPRVAFILDGPGDGPVPDWIGARAIAGPAGGLELEEGGVILDVGGAAGPFGADVSQPTLLAYTRLDGPGAADATALARIGARARRDGAVAVVLAPDPALWARLEAWLTGPARDIAPVGAARLLE